MQIFATELHKKVRNFAVSNQKSSKNDEKTVVHKHLSGFN